MHPLTEPGSVALALCNVAEQSFFAFAEPAEADAARTLSDVPAVTAEVHFAGPARGHMRVTMPWSLTRELALAFVGDPDVALDDADLRDMAGEFANMVTGAWLTATDPASTFDLTAPSVTPSGEMPDAALTMQINGQPVWLAWQVE